MKLLRLLALGTATLALVGLQDVPFAAADTSVVIRTYDDFGSNLPDTAIGYQSCAAATAGEEISSTLPDLQVERGPALVPLGARTWGYDPTAPGAVGPYHQVGSMGSIAADQMEVYSGGGTAQGTAFAEVVVDDNNAWYGVAPLSVTAGSWQTVHGAGSTSYTWREVNLTTGATEGSPFTGSIDAMLTEVGGDRPGYVGLGFGCNDSGTFHFDEVQMGTTGDVRTWDFEGGTTTTSIAAVHRTITAGRSPRLRGLLTAYSEDFPAPHLVLQRRAFGSTHWRRIATVPATVGHRTPDFVARYRATPLRRTSYRWRYLTNEANDGGTSKALTVKVHTAVKAHAPTTVPLGSKVRVTGRTLPKKPGQRITLWRGDHLLDAARVGRRGAFSLATTAHFRGRLSLVVRIGRSPGNLRGWKNLVVKVR